MVKMKEKNHPKIRI